MTDERDLDDPALAAAWRAQANEAPPPALDAAILAAAHRAVKSAPAKIGPGGEATRPWRWWMPLAAAAAIGVVAIGVIQQMPPAQDPAGAIVSDTPPGAPGSAPAKERKAEAVPAQAAPPGVSETTPQAAAPEPAKRTRTETARAQAVPQAPPLPAQRQEPSRPIAGFAAEAERDALRDAAPRAATPEPFPARKDAPAAQNVAPATPPLPPMTAPAQRPAPATAPDTRKAQTADAFAAPETAGRRAAVPAAAPSATAKVERGGAGQAAGALAVPAPPAASADAATPHSTDEWIAHIRRLRAEGDETAARRALADFRIAFPDADARLPPGLQAWAATIPR